MYRLTVVAGPGRGTVFKIKDGENHLGRQLGNAVVLPSTQISKQHCVLVASNGKIVLKDEGSANGTYVNGSLTRKKELQSGDRIGVGEYILEVTIPNNVVALSSRVPQRPGTHNGIQGFTRGLVPVSSASTAPAATVAEAVMPDHGGAGAAGNLDTVNSFALENVGPPKDLLGRALWGFENYVMPVFYGMNLKTQWRIICGIIFGAFILINLAVSVQPLLDANETVILKESMKRAGFMAKVIAEKNTAPLAAGNETRAEIALPGYSDSRSVANEGIILAALTDLDLRIIAPAQRINQYLLSGVEMKVAKKLSALYRDGHESGYQGAFGDTVVAVEPVKVFRGGKNVVVAMAIVSLDASSSVMGMGELGLVYSETLIITGLLGLLALFIMYRLTLKPLAILNEDMDKALKGELTQVTHEFKFEELNSLWDLINSAIQRIPRASSSDASQSADAAVNPEQYVSAVQAIAEATHAAVAICGPDRRVLFMSSSFERVTGIRAGNAVGQDFTTLGTDESIGAMVNELFDRVSPGGEAVTDDKEFSGVQYQLYAAAFGAASDSAPKAYVLTVVAKGD